MATRKYHVRRCAEEFDEHRVRSSSYTRGVLAPGAQIDRYELVSPIGEGGMAEVWVARQRGKHGFEKLFALKCIHSRYAEEPAFRTMFLDEARIAAAIDHPNVAQVFDLGELGSLLYLVMEYVDGESLAALLSATARRTNAPAVMPPAVALRIIADACAGLHAAHRLTTARGELRGVVHRDVSPQNILVGVRGDVKVIDFGIAHAKDRIAGDTEDGALKGKLHYMAPEQARREPLGAYTDVFAAGATLYRLLAGFPPFDGGNDAATLQLLMGDALPPRLPDHVPPLVAAITERALAKNPGDRYASASAMQTAIEAAIAEEGLVADVGRWASTNLSDKARARRAALSARTMEISSSQAIEPPPAPSFSFELGPLPVKPPPAPPLPEAPPPIASRPPLASSSLHSPTLASATSRPPVVVAEVGIPEPEETAQADETGASTPGMLDVRALVARAGSSPHVPTPPESAPAPARQSEPPARRGAEARDAANAAGPKPAPAKSAPAKGAKDAKPANAKADAAEASVRGWMKVAAFAVLLVVVISAVLLVLPRVVHDRVVSSAREAGIELTVGRVGIGTGGVALRDVGAKLTRVPGVQLHAEEVFAAGFGAREVRVRGLQATLTGRLEDVGPALVRYYEESRPKLAGTSAEPRRISIVAARATWAGLLGEGTRLSAAEVGAELESHGVGSEDVRASVGRFDVTTPRTTFGPWAASFDRNASTSRLRLLFDPPVPDGPSALFVSGTSASPHLTVRVPRSPIGRLGVRPEDLALPADGSSEVEVKLEIGEAPSTRIEASGRIDVFGARLRGLKAPVDVRLEGGASGLPGRPLDLEKTTATIGPFVASVTGTVTPTSHGFRVDAAWRTQPIACEKLARAEAKSMGAIAAALQEVAHATGAIRVTGQAHAAGLVKYDTRAPDDASLTFQARETCGLAIFGR